MPAGTEREFSRGRGVLALWAGLLAGPIAWLSILEIKFIIVPWACAANLKWPLYIVTLLGLAVTAGGFLLALRNWRDWSW